MDSLRLFIAIELPAEVRHKIRQHTDRLRSEFPDVRASWAREENLHLTVKFLGDTPVEKVEMLSEALERAATKVESFDMKVAGCGAFPTVGKPKVLWIGVSSAASSLARLHEAIEDECASLAIARDPRSFHPHLTIARLRHPRGARDVAQLHKEIEFESLAVEAKDVCLIRSELSSEGSRYTVMARHEFHRR